MTTKEADEMMLIGAVRMYANANYNKGWDYIVECWSDGDILEALSDAEYDLPTAIKNIQLMVNLYLQRQQEQRADVIDWGEVPNF